MLLVTRRLQVNHPFFHLSVLWEEEAVEEKKKLNFIINKFKKEAVWQ